MDIPDKTLEKCGADSFVMFATSDAADMRYLTRFTSTDPIVYFKKKGQRGVIVVSQMEFERASRESDTAVMTRADAGLLDIIKEEKDKWKALALMISGLAGNKILVPAWFPIALGRELEHYGRVISDKGTIEGMRAKKSPYELESIRMVQQATERAMEVAVALIQKSKPRKGVLHKGRTPLTSECIRAEMHKVLLEYGCRASDTIVSCGKDSAIPHIRGTGPLQEGEPIVIDIFPKDENSGYYSDMSRTICKGEPSSDIADMYVAVRDAQTMASKKIKPGITGADVHQSVVDFFSDHGYQSGKEGFIHNLGHGVGLEVHELPNVGPGGLALSAGNVITNEPGLYFRDRGGVRLENIGVVTKNGFECFLTIPL